MTATTSQKMSFCIGDQELIWSLNSDGFGNIPIEEYSKKQQKSVYYLRLNSMNILTKYNSPIREVSSSNASPFHRDGSLPIGGFLLGE